MVRSRSLQKTMFPVEEKPCEEKARHFAIFLLMRYTGCRISEALAVEEIDQKIQKRRESNHA